MGQAVGDKNSFAGRRKYKHYNHACAEVTCNVLRKDRKFQNAFVTMGFRNSDWLNL